MFFYVFMYNMDDSVVLYALDLFITLVYTVL